MNPQMRYPTHNFLMHLIEHTHKHRINTWIHHTAIGFLLPPLFLIRDPLLPTGKVLSRLGRIAAPDEFPPESLALG